MIDHPNPRMLDAELRELVKLLRRFCDEELDQFADWRMPTKYGEVYIHISRVPLNPNLPVHLYSDLSNVLDQPAPNNQPPTTRPTDS